MQIKKSMVRQKTDHGTKTEALYFSSTSDNIFLRFEQEASQMMEPEMLPISRLPTESEHTFHVDMSTPRHEQLCSFFHKWIKQSIHVWRGARWLCYQTRPLCLNQAER